jgi:flavin-dependent trigonelline monooxygenase, reductase component
MTAATTDPLAGARSTAELRHALAHLPTGVTVVTSVDGRGQPVGTTVSAVCSVSLQPALLLVCLERASSTLQAIHTRRRFTVNVLAAEQHHLSSNFARAGTAASWADVDHRRRRDGSARLGGVVAAFECALHTCYDGGDHEIVLGRIAEVDVAAGGGGPLLHWRGRYERVGAS